MEDKDEVEALLKKLNVALEEFNSRPKPEPITAKEIMQGVIVDILPPDSDKRKQADADIEKRKAELDAERNLQLNLSITPGELCRILQGLVLLGQSFDAEKIVRESVGRSNGTRELWPKIAEVMLVKDPNEKKLRRYDDSVLVRYSALIRAGVHKNDAVKGIYKEFGWGDSGSCRKWICREISNYEGQAEAGGVRHFFADLPKPDSRADE